MSAIILIVALVIVFVLAIAAGIFAGLEEGAFFGIFTGICIFGLGALIACLVGVMFMAFVGVHA